MSSPISVVPLYTSYIVPRTNNWGPQRKPQCLRWGERRAKRSTIRAIYREVVRVLA